MLRTVLCLVLAAPMLYAQASGVKPEAFRKEGPAFQSAVDQAVNEVPGVSLLQTSKASYIQEFGVIVSLEVALERPRILTPFTPDTRSDGPSVLTERQQKLRDKIKQILTQKAAGLRVPTDDQFVAIVVHIFNANPVDSPNLPQQIMVMVKKSAPSNVIFREL